MRLGAYELFEKVFDVLVKHAGASETMRENFMYKMLEWNARDDWGTWEFRFMGNLGMGGKFWLTAESFHVSAYSEDLIGRYVYRKDVINATNEELKKLFVPPGERHAQAEASGTQ
jgi:hypothetical protein